MWLTPCSMAAGVANGNPPAAVADELVLLLVLKRFLKRQPRAPRRLRRAAAVTAAGSILGALFAMIMSGVGNLVRTAHRSFGSPPDTPADPNTTGFNRRPRAVTVGDAFRLFDRSTPARHQPNRSQNCPSRA